MNIALILLTIYLVAGVLLGLIVLLIFIIGDFIEIDRHLRITKGEIDPKFGPSWKNPIIYMVAVIYMVPILNFAPFVLWICERSARREKRNRQANLDFETIDDHCEFYDDK